MSTIELFRLSFPPRSVIETHLKKHPATTFLLTEEKIIAAVAEHFANKELIHSDIRKNIAICLLEEEKLEAICNLNATLQPQEKIAQRIVDNVSSALFDCAKKPVWRSRL